MDAHSAWQPDHAESPKAVTASRAKRSARPFTPAVAALLATVVVTALGQRWLYAALDIGRGGGGSGSCIAEEQAAGSMSEPDIAVPFTKDAWDPPGCTPPQLRTENLAHHGCELWADMCMDQGRFISYAPERKPNLAANFTDRVLLAPRQEGILPGYSDTVRGAKYGVRDPYMRPAGAVRGSEQPDIDARVFSQCTVPLVWWPDPAADLSTLFMDTLPWLHAAAVGEAAMLADRKVKFVPDMDAFAVPNALHWLLLPLSKRTVEELHDLSARRHPPLPGRRCFAQALLCRAGGVRSLQAEERQAAGEAVELPFATPNVPWRPFSAAQWVAEFYANAFPEAAAAAEDEQEGSAGHAGGGVTVLIATAQLTNGREVVSRCNAWKPPGANKAARCEGTDFAPGSMPSDVAALRRADILIGTPAAPLAYGLMMRRGSLVLQLRPPVLPEEFGKELKQAFEDEQGPVSLVNFVPEAEAWQLCDKERRHRVLGREGAWPAEQRLTLDWEQAAAILDVRLGAALGT